MKEFKFNCVITVYASSEEVACNRIDRLLPHLKGSIYVQGSPGKGRVVE
jgi:hypothetical protein